MPSSARDRQAPIDPALQGIDRGMLHLEARFSHEKRMEKIAGGFSRDASICWAPAWTASCADSSTPARRWISAGSRTRASSTISCRRAGDASHPRRAYLPDVAACELACAHVRVAPQMHRRHRRQQPVDTAARRHSPQARCRAAALPPTISGRSSRTAAGHGARSKRETTAGRHFASSNGDQPQIFELAPAIFDLLTALERWVDIASLARRRGRRADRQTSPTPGCSRCAVEDLHHRQIPAHPGRREHADLLDRACARRAGARRSCRDQREGGAAAVSHAHAARKTGSAAKRTFGAGLGHGALDRSGRPLAVLHSDGEPLRLQARDDRRARALRASVRRHLFPLHGALRGRRLSRRADDRACRMSCAWREATPAACGTIRNSRRCTITCCARPQS